jgi:hypothetical protein
MIYNDKSMSYLEDMTQRSNNLSNHQRLNQLEEKLKLFGGLE